jgi:hypothetical protein
LRRAAQAEHQRVGVAVEQIEERLRELDAERTRLRDQRSRLKHRQQILEQVMDPDSGGTIDESPGVVLRGSRLRVEASRVLLAHAGPNRPTHYRDWYELFLQAGFIILSKRPDATFLTAVSRSPVVRRGDEPGTYYIDPSLAADLSSQLSEVQAELSDLEDVLAREPNPKAALRQHRVSLLATRRHADARLSEAEASLAGVALTRALPERVAS